MEAIYQNKYVTVYHGDCLEIMPQLDIKFDCCITDLPYGTIKSLASWDEVIPFYQMWNGLKRLVKDNGAICLFGQQPFSSFLRCSNVPMFRYDWIWEKSHCGNFLCANKQPMKNYEIISIFSKKQSVYNPQKSNTNESYSRSWIKGVYFKVDGVEKQIEITRPRQKQYQGKFPKSIIKFSNDGRQKYHFCQKPVELIEYLIKTYTNENDYVLDFTAGSGTTGIACMNLNRKCILIEKQTKYCNIIISRLQEHEKQFDLFDMV